MRHYISFQILITVLFLSNSLNAQSTKYYGAFESHFFGWNPSARMEAMGKGFVSVEKDPYSYYTNPGAMGTLEGLNVTAGFANPYYLISDGSYNFFSLSYNYPNIGTIGISRDYSDFGKVIAINEFGQELGEYTPYNETYRLSYAREIIDDLYMGLNLNLFRYDYTDGMENGFIEDTGNTFFADFGILKSFNLQPKGEITYKFDVGTSIINFTQSRVEIGTYVFVIKDALPVIFKIGGSYNMGVELPETIFNTKFLNILYTIEYQDVLNASFYNGIKTGFELTFFELLSLRGGFYSLKNRYGSSCSNCKPRVEEFTYGAGINLPLKNLNITKIPAAFKFDISVLPHPALITNPEDFNFGDYRVFNFTASVPL